MKRLSFGRAALLCAGFLLAAATFGCDKPGVKFLIPNERPSVDLTAAPVSSADTAWYSYKMNWSGFDPDGRVERFEYAIDPPTTPDADTLWVSTQKNEQQLFFRATNAYFDPRRGWRSNDYHTFVIRAVDNAGAISAPKSRAFYSYTIAPVVFITNPPPNKFISRLVTPAVRINWQGRDDDGVFTQKPVKYKYRLFRIGDTEYDFQKAQLYPDSLRMFYAARNFAGWDSVGGDTTFVQYTQLTPNAPHLFVVIGIDEAGAYSPEFSLESNMLKFTPGFAGTLGPVFTVWNEFFAYQYVSGGVSTDPLVWINLEAPSGQPITFNWGAAPPEGSAIEWYRWRLDGDISDETPRTDEATDWYHWSRKSNLTTSCTIGPFPGGQDHFLYIEAQDNNGLLSLAIVHFTVVTPTFEKSLLIVDDTRLAVDQFLSSGVPRSYGNTTWPAAAELDTFLYARGGAPWRGPQGILPPLPTSKPGIFNGYSFDTLGTRRGFEIASAGVPLSLLGKYKHVVWLTDITGAITTYAPESVIDPISTLRWMSATGRSNTLAAYIFAGGEVWLAGGTGLTCTMLPYNAAGARNNDQKYGPGYTVFAASAGELVPGRMSWDAAHWQSEFVASRPVTLPRRSAAAVGGWTNPGWKFNGTITAPNYALLPAFMRRRALALGDTLPPTRAGFAASYYSTAINPAVEYLTLENRIFEDIDQSPLVENQASVLDTLYELQGGALATAFTGQRPVAMTYYHGVNAPEFVETGFDLWTWARADVQALTDFVLQQVWKLPKSAPAPAALRPTAAGAQPVSAASRRGNALPIRKSGSR
ncbi:MAG: hypothetical protein IT347_07210 [Candidatus Eisenbacteria bacterium]|nr:hypothetical protein [Candidatus Eisenbacteria bacterium]